MNFQWMLLYSFITLFVGGKKKKSEGEKKKKGEETELLQVEQLKLKAIYRLGGEITGRR